MPRVRASRSSYIVVTLPYHSWTRAGSVIKVTLIFSTIGSALRYNLIITVPTVARVSPLATARLSARIQIVSLWFRCMNPSIQLQKSWIRRSITLSISVSSFAPATITHMPTGIELPIAISGRSGPRTRTSPSLISGRSFTLRISNFSFTWGPPSRHASSASGSFPPVHNPDVYRDIGKHPLLCCHPWVPPGRFLQVVRSTYLQ